MPRRIRHAHVLYGSSTRRAVENFPISDWTMPQSFLRALALIKEHAAAVNGELGVLPKDSASAIEAAAREVKRGEHGKQFPIDIFQTGSGTSTHMNMNEVIAALAGARIHPNDHVNAGQSSNDVIPSALQIACALHVRDVLVPALQHLQRELEKKAKEFHSIVKTGRTHLMDAAPVRLGDEFRSYATLIGQAASGVEEVMKRLCILPLGGTAVGTGLNAHPEFAKHVIARLAKETKLPLQEAGDHPPSPGGASVGHRIAAQSCPLALLALSSVLREVAVVLTKIAQDIRLMGSGPISGLNELVLPELQPGSSIMPGKVNPVLCESVLQVAAWIIGADATITTCIAQSSNFELSTCFPLLASKLLTSLRLLANVSDLFADKCVRGIKANERAIRACLARNPMLATALVPEIGYDAAAKIAKEAMEKGMTILEVALKRTKIPRKELGKMLDPRRMV